jgi:hypothetical protein
MMRGLPPIGARETFRVRRWDAVILGGALPGLIAAIRLGMRGNRVLILEEEAAAAVFPGVREPFLMAGNGQDGVLGACMKELGIPLIDRRSFRSESLAYQVAFPKARVDVGEIDWTASELEAWDFTPDGTARSLLRSLRESAEARQDTLPTAGLASNDKRMNRAAQPPWELDGAHAKTSRSSGALDPWQRGAAGNQQLATYFDAQLRALSNFAERPPTAPVRTRLLGSALGGAAETGGRSRWLRDLLGRRIETLYGEVRRFSGDFRLVSAGNRPAVALEDSADICAGRALLINAPLPTLRKAGGGASIPDLLKGPDPSHRRWVLHLRGHRNALPLGMAPRVIRVVDPSKPIEGTNVIGLRVFGALKDGDPVDIVASAVVPIDANGDVTADEIESAVTSLMPLGREGWERVTGPQPRWDRDGLLSDPPGSGSRRFESQLRPAPRTAAYVLDRTRTGALGFEGDLLLGWHAGDTVAADIR